MSKCLLITLMTLLFSVVGVASENMCAPEPAQFAVEPLKEFIKHSCEDIKASKECQDVYAEIKAGGGTPEDKAINCSEKNVLVKGLMDLNDIRIGCASGGWDFVVDSFKSVGTALGEGAAKAVLSIEQEKAANAECDKDPAKKKALYTDYNVSVPKMLQIEVPDDATLARVGCARLKAGVRVMQTRQGFVAMDKVHGRLSDPKATYSADEQKYVDWINEMKSHGEGKLPDFRALAEAKLSEMGIKLACYNTRAAAALTCEAMATVVSLAAGPAGAAVKAARASKIAELAGVRIAEMAEKRATLKSAKETLERSLTPDEKQAVWQAHKIGEGRGFRENGGAPGEYTMTDLRNKAKKLDEVGTITRPERRKLVENKVVGQPVGQPDQQFIVQLSESISRGNSSTATTAFADGGKYYKAKMNASAADFKKAFPENDLTSVVQANYSGLGTQDASKLVNKYIEVHGYSPEQGKLAIISRLRRETTEFQSAAKSAADPLNLVKDYKVYRNKELEYKLTLEYYETRYPTKYNELDYDRLSPGQRQNLEKLQNELKTLREEARKNKWPTAGEGNQAY